MKLCTICARAGSKGVKNKNIKEILGKPLIAYSIEQALKTGLFDDIAVSSDSDEILSVAKRFGANILVKRSKELASDTAAKLPVIQNCASEAERITGKTYDMFIDLDASSPLRLSSDIKDSLELLEQSSFGNLITGTPSRRSPYFNLVELGSDGGVQLSKKIGSGVVRRQDAPKSYDMNASIYIWKRNSFFSEKSVLNEKTMLFEMPEERSYDIDSPLDYEIVKMIMEQSINV